MKNKLLPSLLISAASLSLFSVAQAAGIVDFYGYQINTPEWRSTNVPKTITFPDNVSTISDADNAYGTLGWNLPQFNGAPSFIAAVAEGTLVANRGNAGYEPIDDPGQPIGPNVSDLPPNFRAIAYQAPGVGGEANLYQLTLQGASIPSSFLLGVGFGNLANPSENPFGAASYRVSIGASNSGQVPAIGNDGLTDWIFFRVNDGVAGDVINVFGTAGSQNFVSVAALSYDVTPVPEPGSIAFLAMGAAGLVVVYRRRRQS